MATVTWRSVLAPQTQQANNLRISGGDTVSKGIAGLGAAFQQPTKDDELKAKEQFEKSLALTGMLQDVEREENVESRFNRESIDRTIEADTRRKFEEKLAGMNHANALAANDHQAMLTQRQKGSEWLNQSTRDDILHQQAMEKAAFEAAQKEQDDIKAQAKLKQEKFENAPEKKREAINKIVDTFAEEQGVTGGDLNATRAVANQLSNTNASVEEIEGFIRDKYRNGIMFDNIDMASLGTLTLPAAISRIFSSSRSTSERIEKDFKAWQAKNALLAPRQAAQDALPVPSLERSR